ncbi:DUF1232 domain-containing protein [Vibrio sp. Of7-15]|uniref:YkvA family protein n=1 Tax=Vibrio sp. Of7-15 TaxID=2724879 RepID=UPI001EF388CC|nr:YkvA family protein [Vibrio sp. Of7-15]MCG7500003.1 DUF1232 domain-containing protein [Vibrio sp. Of7-15]
MSITVNKAPSEKSFWKKVTKGAKKMGEEVAVLGIKSWLAMSDSNTPTSAKMVLGGALAYLVMPVDAIPDVLVGVGYTDDLAALGAAVKTVGDAVTQEHEAQAREKWKSL